VLSCAQRARLFASAFTEVVVEAAAFEAPIHGDIVISAAYRLPYFYFVL
jgi:hypothetical protein